MKQKYSKWVVGAASAALVASAIVPVASAASFSDIESSDHKDAILALADANIVGGYTDGTFKPNAVVTRGNVTKFLGKWLVSEGYEIPADYKTVARFTDLPTSAPDQELLQYAALVKDAGVFKGSNNKLMHTNNMSREQMAVVLVRAINTVYGVDLVADYKESEFKSAITDLDKATATENREAIIALEYAGLTNVKAFNPKNSLTRGQFASFLNRTITNVATLTVKEAKAVDANTLEVTLSDDTKHTVKLETPLEENKATKVEFEIEGKKYSAEVTYEVTKFKVESANATNGTITVKLAEKAEAVEAKNFTVTQAINGGAATEVKASAAVLAADGLTVTLTVEKVAAQEITEQSVVYTVNEVAAPAFVVEAKTLAVTSVSALNAKEVQIKFNQKVKKATLTSTDISITPAGSTALALDTTKGTNGFALSTDGTTVTVYLAAPLVNATGYDVKIGTGVLNEKGEGLKENSVKTFQFNDTVKPSVTSIESVNGSVVVNFSEKLAAVATTVVINGQSHTVTPNAGDTKVVIPKANFTGAAALEAGKSYSVVVAGAQDYVTNAMDLYQGSVVYSVLTDTVAPTVASVKVTGEKTFEVTFSEEIKLVGATPVASDLGLSVVNTAGTVPVSTVTTKDNKTFVVTLGATPFTGLSTSGTATATFASFKDLALNVGTTKAETLTFSKDTQAPKFVSSEYNANTKKITLNFDEVLATDTTSTVVATTDVQIIDNKTGQVVATAAPSEVIEANSKSVVFDNATLGLPAGSYTLNVKAGAVSDTASTANSSTAFSTQVTISGSVAVKPAITTVAADASNVITVTFDSAKGAVKGGNVAGSATLAENYKLNGKALPTGSVLTIDNTNQIVTITLPKGSIEASGSQILTVSGVQAIASTATIDTVNQIVTLTDTKAPEIKTAVVNANGDLVLTFTENVQGTGTGTGVGTQPIVGDFIIAVDGTQITTGLTLANGTSNDQVIIKSADVSLATGTITVKATGTTTGQDAAGNTISVVGTVTATR